MTQIKRLPYLCPSENNIEVGEWQMIQDGEVQCIKNTLPSWDPAVSLKGFATIKIKTGEIYRECNFGNDAVLALVSVWHSEGTMLRGVGEKIILSNRPGVSEYIINIDVEGLLIAKWIDLSIELVLVNAGSNPSPITAKFPGSILFQSKPFRIYLEGEGARFPVEVIDFSQTQYPDEAGWALFWDPYNLHQSVLGDLRLYINSRNERVSQAVSGNKEGDYEIQEAIRYDVARILIEGALNNDEFISNPETYAQDSVGFMIKNMIWNYFPNTDLYSLRDELQNSLLFEPKLQDKFRLFQKRE